MKVSKDESLLIDDIERQRKEKIQEAKEKAAMKERRRRARAQWWSENGGFIFMVILVLAVASLGIWAINRSARNSEIEAEQEKAAIQKTGESNGLLELQVEKSNRSDWNCERLARLWTIRYVRINQDKRIPVIKELCCHKGICTYTEGGAAF